MTALRFGNREVNTLAASGRNQLEKDLLPLAISLLTSERHATCWAESNGNFSEQALPSGGRNFSTNGTEVL